MTDTQKPVYPRDNALEIARSEVIGVLAWKAGHGNETLSHPDQALLARSFLAVSAELDYRDATVASSHTDKHDELPLERLKTEAERWIPFIAEEHGDSLGNAARGLRDIVQRAHDLGFARSAALPTGDEWAMTGRDFDACEKLYAGSIKCSDELPEDQRPHTKAGKRMFRYIHALVRSTPSATADTVPVPRELLREVRNMCLRVVSGEYEAAKVLVAKLDAAADSTPSSATRTMSPAEAANVVLEIRDQTVMSKYVTQAECRAARDALWQAAAILRSMDSADRTISNAAPQDAGSESAGTMHQDDRLKRPADAAPTDIAVEPK